MNISSQSSPRISPPAWIVLAALLLLAAGVGLVVWWYSAPTVLSAGHRWALFPSTGQSEVDGSSEQQKLAFDGNVQLFSVLYMEHVAGQGEQVREALCHVLFDLPPKGVLHVTGGGSHDGVIYRRVKLTVQDGAEATPLEKQIELRFQPSGSSLTILFNDNHFQVSTQAGNVIVLRIGDDGNVGEFNQTTESVKSQLTPEDVKRLLGKAKTD
jgi:hypothetical protein